METYFAGVNTARLAAATEGRTILVSFADVIRRPGVWERDIRPRLEAGAYKSAILDSGAFTVISAGITIDVEDYAAFAVEFGHLFDVVVNLDDIAGDVETSARNQAHLEAAGVDAMPVFHQGEDWEILEGYVATHDYIGVGLARKPGGRLAHPVSENVAWLEDLFERVGDRARVHGFGMTALAKRGLPFATVDSTSWIAEFRALRTGATYQGETKSVVDAPSVLVAGDLANLINWYGDDQLLELTLDSYDPPAAPANLDLDTLAEFGEWIETDARSQARSVFRRYGAARLSAKFTALDLALEEAA